MSGLLLVMIVDDNDRNRKLARDVLRSVPFLTLEASTAEQAIALASEHLPDLVLMDLRLPDADGTEAVRRLRAQARTAGIPVVALTALPLGPDDAWLAAAGFAGYIAKPFDVEALPGLVRRFAESRLD